MLHWNKKLFALKNKNLIDRIIVIASNNGKKQLLGVPYINTETESD